MDATILISLLKQKLEDGLLQQSTRSNPRFENQVNKAINNLQSLKKLLKELEDPGEEEALSVDLFNDPKLSQILKVVYSMDDAIDTLIIRRELQQINNSTESGFKRFMGFKSLHITHKMKKFNDKIRCLVENEEAVNSETEDYNNNNTILLSQQPGQLWGRISGFCLEEEKDAVGLQHHIKELLIRLRSDCAGPQSTTQVIAVIGEGGSGKTTLTRTVYNKVEVKRHFTKRAWIHVPSSFNARHVLADILKQIHEVEMVVEATLSEDELMWRLTKVIAGNKYLIVLDDVETPQVWESLLKPLCSESESRGGRIVVTTRDADLSTQAAHAALHLGRLSKEESWKLFLNKVGIAEDHELNNSELFTLKEKILNICGGLPLAIVLLGGLLSTKHQSEWSRVIVQASNTKGDILALSYQDLPSQVKPCFLYMGLFPRAFEISVRRLIHLWSAEGFFTTFSSEDIDTEDQAQRCFEELVIRNMIQVRWRLDGSPKTCFMHNVVYDYFSTRAANVGFFTHQLESSAKQPRLAVRRLAIDMGNKSYFPSSFLRIRNLRSYLVFDTRIRAIPAREIGLFLHRIISNRGFALLNVLDLEGVYKPELSDDVITKLPQLRYLSLKSTFLDTLPLSVGELLCLETLDVRQTNMFEFKTLKSKKLQHLYLNPESKQFWVAEIEEDILTNLHTIWDLFMSSRGMHRLSYLTGLTKLKVTAVELQDDVAEWISKLTELQCLKLKSLGGVYGMEVSNIKLRTLAEHHGLQQLYLIGELSKHVVDICFLPPNLTKLTLSLSQLREDPMPVLGQLLHLHILRLFGDSYIGEHLSCLSGGFLKLRVLKLWKLPIKEWTVEDGAMPCLRMLEIRGCNNLIKPPQGLENVITLRELVLTNMEESFEKAVKGMLKGNQNTYIKTNSWKSSSFKEVLI